MKKVLEMQREWFEPEGPAVMEKRRFSTSVALRCCVCGTPYIVERNGRPTCRVDGKRIYRADEPDEGWCSFRCCVCHTEISKCVTGAEYETPHAALTGGEAVPSEAMFDRCVETRQLNDGTIEIRCKLGLWAVSCRDQEQAEREARHYWTQYHSDGEYNSLLSNAEQHARGDCANGEIAMPGLAVTVTRQNQCE